MMELGEVLTVDPVSGGGFSTRFSRAEYDGWMLLKIAAAADGDAR